MKNSTFKLFKETIAKADTTDPIWYCGYLWIDLTQKQAIEIVSILEKRHFPMRWNERMNWTEIVIPSGMGIALDQLRHHDR